MVSSVRVVTILQFLQELASVDGLYVGAAQVETGYLAEVVFQHATHHRGVEKYARFNALAYHVVHRRICHVAVMQQRRRLQRRTVIGPHGRQLGVVAYQNQSAIASLAHVCYKVLQKRSAAEYLAVARRIGEHRRLVDDEHRALLLVHVERVFRLVIGVGALAVDAFVDGEGLLPRIACQHLRRAPRRSQQNALHARLAKHGDQCRNECRFARSRIAVEHENTRIIA